MLHLKVQMIVLTYNIGLALLPLSLPRHSLPDDFLLKTSSLALTDRMTNRHFYGEVNKANETLITERSTA
jgi:hypothetical protein